MYPHHLPLLICPKTGSALTIEADVIESDGRIRSGSLVNRDGTARYPIVEYVPRFVDQKNYCESFSVEWKHHPKTLHEKYSGYDFYKVRYYKETRWGEQLPGQVVLEAGSGCGSFTTHALNTGATIVSFDLSSGVDANYHVNGGNPRLLLVQADIYHMPFRDGFADKSFCFGVIQHTPNPKASLAAIAQKTRPGGDIATDIYMHDPADPLLVSKYFLRRFTANMSSKRLYKLIRLYVNGMWYPSMLIKRLPRIGWKLNRAMLIDHSFSGQLAGARRSYLKDMNILNIFDMLGPAFDYPETVESYRAWHEELGLETIDVCRGYNGVEGHARIPAAGIARVNTRTAA